MRIGLLSDVHADLTGLELALAVFRKQAVDQIICVGDLVDRGDEGDAVVQRVRDLKIPTVQGNHDWLARCTQDFWKRNPQHITGTPQMLSEETLSYLDGLPRRLNFTFEGRTISVHHASPWDISARIEPFATHKLMKRVLREAKTHIVVLGHTHRPMVIHFKNYGTIINPGSTYQNHPSQQFPASDGRSCAILELPHGDVTHYDIQRGEVMPAVRRFIAG